jgi:hypothetical protein
MKAAGNAFGCIVSRMSPTPFDLRGSVRNFRKGYSNLTAAAYTAHKQYGFSFFSA